jgi:dipeptidyl aminopeptidase/acylaminoacyl peptidase
LELRQTPPFLSWRSAVTSREHVERIALPLLIMHGDLDRTVMVEQSRDLVAKVEAARKPFRSA